MWLDNLKELKKAKGISSKQIAEQTNLPERTVVRIFSGDTPNPYLDTLHRIVVVLGGSLDDILADSKTVVGNKSLVTMQEEIDKLKEDIAALTDENVMLNDKLITLSNENDVLKTTLKHKEEIIKVHSYYASMISGMAKGHSKKHDHE